MSQFGMEFTGPVLRWVSKLNGNHARYAWLSLFSIALVDLYIWGLAAGWYDDPRFF